MNHEQLRPETQAALQLLRDEIERSKDELDLVELESKSNAYHAFIGYCVGMLHGFGCSLSDASEAVVYAKSKDFFMVRKEKIILKEEEKFKTLLEEEYKKIKNTLLESPKIDTASSLMGIIDTATIGDPSKYFTINTLDTLNTLTDHFNSLTDHFNHGIKYITETSKLSEIKDKLYGKFTTTENMVLSTLKDTDYYGDF